MSLETRPGHPLTPVSPPSSGRSSPVPRATRRNVEGDLFRADKSLRRYGATIERALSSWEISPEEWADYIAFLARLLKAIQTHPKDPPILPHTTDISTRLAQCLNPALPAGVHQKALEVYAYIFATFRSDYIASHVHDFLPGLAPVLSFASLAVRPSLYEIFEYHIIKIPTGELRPALKSVILSLLPALEEGQGEDFERAYGILNTLEKAFTPENEDVMSAEDADGYFWQCLFLAVITSPLRRQGALNYLLRTLPKFPVQEAGSRPASTGKSKPQRLPGDIECIVSPEPGLLIRCFVSGLSDSQVLVQRGFLDLLVSNIPLNSIIFQDKVGSEDLDRLVAAAVQVILRKDMSLNRRLWSWFLGPEPKDQPEDNQSSSASAERKPSNTQLDYFSIYGRASLERCVLRMLQAPALDAAARARPYRICSSLMDRWEIGGLLVPRIFLPALESLYDYRQSSKSSDVADVVRSANTFFDGVEASLIWGCLVEIVRDALDRQRSPERKLDLFEWIVDTFNVKDEEMITLHIPLTMFYLATHIMSHSQNPERQAKIISIITKLLELLPARILQATPSTDTEGSARKDASAYEDTVVQKTVYEFYRSADQVDRGNSPYSVNEAVSFICARTIQSLSAALTAREAKLYQVSSSLLVALLSKVKNTQMLPADVLYDTLSSVFATPPTLDEVLPFPMLNTTVNLLLALGPSQSSNHLAQPEIVNLEPAISAQLWRYLSPEVPKWHVEATRCLWYLEEATGSPEGLIASLSSLVGPAVKGSRDGINLRVEAFRRFTTLWAHSTTAPNAKAAMGKRGSAVTTPINSKQPLHASEILEQPLLILLDTLDATTDPVCQVVRSWLQHLPNLDQIFQVLFKKLSRVAITATEAEEPSADNRKRRHRDATRELEYILMHFKSILANGNDWTWRSLGKTLVPASCGIEERDGISFLAVYCTQSIFSDHHTTEALNRQLINVLELLLSGPAALEFQPLELDSQLISHLITCVNGEMHALQVELLKVVQLALRLRLDNAAADVKVPDMGPFGVTATKRPSNSAMTRPSTSSPLATSSTTAPAQLLRCIQLGFSSPHARYHLDHWLIFLAEVLPSFADAIFANLLPLAGTFCNELGRSHEQLVRLVTGSGQTVVTAPEAVIMNLLDGLEMILDRAYESLVDDTVSAPTPKEPETRSNFFSTVASGVFKSEGPPSRTATANTRLTVILAFQDAIRTTLRMWLWASAVESFDFDPTSAATSAHNALKIRNKTRHVLEQIFSVEPLESLEAVIAHWCGAETQTEASTTLSLLHVMQVSRPKNIVPAILDALCTRTNPSAIPSSRHSSETADLSPSNIATFFSAYLHATEDDAMDEVWPDCMSFLKDVLSNPLPYRQVLPHFLSITLLLAEKVSNTNFGEQRKMRREVGDIFQRLLTATFTTLPSQHITEPVRADYSDGEEEPRRDMVERSMALLPVLSRVTSKIDFILDTAERVAAAINNISQSLISPIFRAKSFPKNVSLDLLELLGHVTRKAPAGRTWKKEVENAFNDPRILASPLDVMFNGWLPVIHQWSVHEKERMPELLSRLAPPSSAGIMFGVGASAARLEADRRTQLTLRRICILLLASPEDTYVAHLRAIEEKLAELFDASPSSSPSAAVKAELFMLCRTITLSVSTYHLSPLWPLINANLQALLSSLLPHGHSGNDFNNLTLLQGCKLLDLLIALSPDEFQLHEWLYITDTIDAVYRPVEFTSAALSDHIADGLGLAGLEDSSLQAGPSAAGASKRRLLLGDDLAMDREDIKAMAHEDFVRTVLRPFLSQLSIHAYEGVYSLDQPDLAALRRSMLSDLLDVSSIVD